MIKGEKIMDIVSIGEPLMELSNTEKGIYKEGFGGDTSNFLMAAARQGAQTAYFTQVGQDTFGDAFMNFGVAGLIAYPILNVVCIRLLDGVAGNEPIAYLIAVVFSTTEYIVNGSFLPVLFNYGYFAFLIYLALIKKYGGLEATFGEWFGHGGYRAQGTGQSMQNTANRRNAGMGADGE